MSLWSRARSLLTRAEGDYRPGPYLLPMGGWLPANSPLNYWQLGRNIESFDTNALVEACISAYSQTTAMTQPDHWRSTGNGGRERVTTSALSRVLRNPNAYQTISDFLLNAVRSLYLNGNAYALAIRNSRYEIVELHLMHARSCNAMVAETGEIFYSLAGNEVIDWQLANRGDYNATAGRLMVPARDVLHIRLHTSRRTLLGETPLQAALRDIAFADAAQEQQVAYYLNQSRPSMVLMTDQVLDKDQVQHLRDRWNEQSRGLAAGGTPILTAGLKAVPIGNQGLAKDADLAKLLEMSAEHIALVFRIPMAILGIGATATGPTEVLMQSWIASGLGFCLNHIEEAFDHLYELDGVPDEYVECDTSVLLRSAFKERVEGYARGVQTGIWAPNEARDAFDLPKVADGDAPRVQQQQVPLNWPGFAAPPQPPKMPPPTAPALPQRAVEEISPHDSNQLRRRFRSSAAHNYARDDRLTI